MKIKTSKNIFIPPPIFLTHDPAVYPTDPVWFTKPNFHSCFLFCLLPAHTHMLPAPHFCIIFILYHASLNSLAFSHFLLHFYSFTLCLLHHHTYLNFVHSSIQSALVHFIFAFILILFSHYILLSTIIICIFKFRH
jgi:hypothetical protein